MNTSRKLRLGPLPKTESVKLTFSCSITLKAELDRYAATRPLTRWLFPARTGEQPMSTSTAQHIFEAAKARASIQKPGSIHLLRSVSA